VRLTSTHNPTIKFVRSLQRATVRAEEGLCLVEGVRLVREALQSKQRTRLLLYDPAALGPAESEVTLLAALIAWADEAYEVAPHVMRSVADTETPSGVLAVLELPVWGSLSDLADAQLGVILNGVSDPGNAGSIARTALAAGAAYLVTTPGSVDPFAPKVVRAGMGAHFRLPIFSRMSWPALDTALARSTFVAAAADGEESLAEFAWPDRTTLVIGSEAHGLTEEADQRVSARVRIPMRRGVESLNASVAAGILMYCASDFCLLEDTERYK
jgi:TrmH family RNA methyltransferase